MGMLIKNSNLTGSITEQGKKGEGVLWHNGMPIYVANAIPGDTVDVKIVRVEKRRAFGRVVRLVSPSEHRVIPKCPIADHCGGCQLQHQSQPAQVAFKANLLAARLSRAIDVPAGMISPVVAGDQVWGTRNKMQFAFGMGDDGLQIGLYAPRSHRVVDALHCHVMPPAMNHVLVAVREWHQEHPLPVFNETMGDGVLRHLTIRYAHATHQLMVVVTVAVQCQLSEFVAAMADVPGMTSVHVCIQPDATLDQVLGPNCHGLWGTPSITDVVAGIRCRVSPHSFMQANATLVNTLYALVLGHLPSQGQVIDLYCGAGVLACAMAKQGCDVVGVDSNASAIDDAMVNAANNGVHVEFHCMDVADYLTNDFPKGATVVVDPPRKGLHPTVVAAIIGSQVSHLVMVSCNPDTLARDLRLFLDGGYVMSAIQPVDMFCHTPHIECVVCLALNTESVGLNKTPPESVASRP